MKEINLTRRSMMVSCVGFAIITPMGLSAQAQSDADFSNVIAARLQAIDQILRLDLPEGQKRQSLVQIIHPTLSASDFATGALGHNARTITSNQRHEVAGLLGDMIALQESDIFLQNSAATMSIVGAQASSRGRGTVQVDLSKPDGSMLRLSYSLSEHNGGYLISNIIVDGTNMGVSYRSTLGRLFEAHNGDVVPVIDALAQRRAEMN